MATPSLAELQRAFASLSTGATDVPAHALVSGSLAMSPGDGMQIYADMFTWRQIDSLSEDFPKLAALTGDECYGLCQAYLTAYPSRHHSLAQLGRSLSVFLASRTGLRSDLSDLAALEWARCEVFEEAALPTLDALQVADVERGLRIVPALRVLWLEHDVASVWKAIEDGSEVPAPLRGPSCHVVWRKGFDVFHVRLGAVEAEAFALAASGAALSQVCEAFAEQADPLGEASRAIGSWFSEGWIAAH